MKKTSLLFLCFLMLAAHALLSQQLRFRHITSEDGLSTNAVNAILQDDKGFMWFGTQDGLNRYDGFTLKVFKNDPTDPNSLPGSEIMMIKQLRHDLIVIGTRTGIGFLNPVTEKFMRLPKADERLQGRINAVYKLDSLTALVGTEKGLFRMDLDKKTVIRSLFTNEEVNVRCISNINNKVYIGTGGKGLWQLAPDGSVAKAAYTNLSGSTGVDEAMASITHIEQYDGRLYLGTEGHGIAQLNADMGLERIISFAEQNANCDYITDFSIRNNRLYATTAFGVLVYNLQSRTVNFYNRGEAAFALNSDPCSCIYIDGENNCWIGTGLGGVNIAFSRSLKFPLSDFKYETTFGDIFSFCEEKKGQLLIGGVKTLGEFDLATGAYTDHSKLFGTATALCIVRESESIYWIGTWGNGLYRYDINKKTGTPLLSSEVGGTILCLKIAEGYLYAGSVGDGLFKISLQTLEVTRFTEKEGLPDMSINTIFNDSKGQVWLGTYGGLMMMKGWDKDGKLAGKKIYRNDGKSGQVASNVVFAVNEDAKGNIWAATSTGLSKLMPDGSFYNYYERDGLSNGYLLSLLKDSLGNFWMSSNSGIIKFNPLGPEKEVSFKNYNAKDGLVNTEYNVGAAFVSASGNMYFGGAKGFNVFRPTAIKDNLHAPAAYVIGYKRGGKDVATDTLITYKKHLKLSWRENYFQFELAALDYTDPAKNKFKYRLKGYDDDWSAPTNVRYVSYTELPGGDYTFEVVAANNDGTWNETPYEIGITVVPPFWKTKLFYCLVILFGVGGIIAFTQYRTRAIKKENKILENKVAERTKELAEKNHDIMSSIQYAKRIQEAMLPSRELIFKKLQKVFILYKPKDIVSGDFYWFNERSGVKIFAVVDCTGHGVPGAFMSMIGHNLLNQIVLEKGITDPGQILNNLHKGIQEALRQGKNEINTNDGMDVSLLTINDAEHWVKWAGANRPLVVLNAQGELTKYDANKFPVGGAQLDSERVFTTQLIPVNGPSMAYMTSDGYADQFGGDNGKKFMVKRYHDLLMQIHLRSAEEQRSELDTNFEQWKASHEQVDDVLVVGIQLQP